MHRPSIYLFLSVLLSLTACSSSRNATPGGTGEKFYEIQRKQSIQRVRFVKIGSETNQVDIFFMRNGSNNYGAVTNLQLSYSSGSLHHTMNSAQIRYIDTPFDARVHYFVPSKFNASMIDCELDFTLTAPGHWRVYLYN